MVLVVVVVVLVGGVLSTDFWMVDVRVLALEVAICLSRLKLSRGAHFGYTTPKMQSSQLDMGGLVGK